MNDEIPSDDITNQSIVVRWSSVNDIFPVNYTVRWYRGDTVIGMATVNGLSYTVTGLTANTSYNVTVVAINTCCGAGPVSDVVMVMTNNEPPTIPPPTTTITPMASSTPPPGNNVSYSYVIATYVSTLKLIKPIVHQKLSGMHCWMHTWFLEIACFCPKSCYVCVCVFVCVHPPAYVCIMTIHVK